MTRNHLHSLETILAELTSPHGIPSPPRSGWRVILHTNGAKGVAGLREAMHISKRPKACVGTGMFDHCLPVPTQVPHGVPIGELYLRGGGCRLGTSYRRSGQDGGDPQYADGDLRSHSHGYPPSAGFPRTPDAWPEAGANRHRTRGSGHRAWTKPKALGFCCKCVRVSGSWSRVGRLPSGLRPGEATVRKLGVDPQHREPQMPRGRGALRYAAKNVGRPPGGVKRRRCDAWWRFLQDRDGLGGAA